MNAGEQDDQERRHDDGHNSAKELHGLGWRHDELAFGSQNSQRHNIDDTDYRYRSSRPETKPISR